MSGGNEFWQKYRRNSKTSVWGEVVGSAVALVSVFVARKVLPQQTENVTQRLSEILEKRGKSPEEARETAERVIDVILMNIGGAASSLTQFAIRRMADPNHKYPLSVDLAALVLGRISGTTTMSAGLYFTEKYAKTPLRASEDALADVISWVGNQAKGKNDAPVSHDIKRAAYVLISNVLQSLFAIPGNALGQSYVEKLADSRAQKLTPQR